MRMRRVVLLVSLLAIGPVLAGCSNFDPDSLDVFGLNEKKKLPGERKELFPGGVPGVTQGIPSQYVQGNQQTPEATQAAPAAPPAEEAKPKAKPKPKPRTASRPTRVTVQPASQQQQQQQPAAQSPWPAPSQSSSTSPWPSSPAPGTFSKQ